MTIPGKPPKATRSKPPLVQPASGFWNDLDMLETGNGGWAKGSNQSTVEYRTEFSMWAILASPLVVTTPLRRMTGCDDVHCNGRCQDCRDQDKGGIVNGKPHCPNGADPKHRCSAKCSAALSDDQASVCPAAVVPASALHKV